MANYEATRYDFDGANLTGIEGIPTATLTCFPNATASGGTTGSTGGGSSHDHTLSANFVGSSNSVLQPYLVLIYIIKT
jgi:hypothetical protein